EADCQAEGVSWQSAEIGHMALTPQKRMERRIGKTGDAGYVTLAIDIETRVVRRASEVANILGLAVIPHDRMSVQIFTVAGCAGSLPCVVDGDGERIDVACEGLEFVNVALGKVPEDRPTFGLCLWIAGGIDRLVLGLADNVATIVDGLGIGIVAAEGRQER